MKRDGHWEDTTHPMSKILSRQLFRGYYETRGHKALSRKAMTHRAQNLSDPQSRVQGHAPTKENHHGPSARTDMILKDLLVFGSVLLAVSSILYLIF